MSKIFDRINKVWIASKPTGTFEDFKNAAPGIELKVTDQYVELSQEPSQKIMDEIKAADTK